MNNHSLDPFHWSERKAFILLVSSATVGDVHCLEIRRQSFLQVLEILRDARQLIPAARVVGHADQQSMPAVTQVLPDIFRDRRVPAGSLRPVRPAPFRRLQPPP